MSTSGSTPGKGESERTAAAIRHAEAEGLLPLYAAGSLEAMTCQALEAHITTCAECRADLTLWLDVGSELADQAAALPRVETRVLDATLARVRVERRPSVLWGFERARTLVGAQVLLLRQEIWMSSLLVMLLGYVVALVSGQADRAASVIGALAPLVAAAGVALVYGPDVDPGLELALATPTSPRQVLLARLVVVFGYDLVLALAATVGLLPLVPVDLLGGIVLGWLAPMTFLSALALLLSLRLGAEAAASAALVVWIVRWLARGFATQSAAWADPGAAFVAGSRLIDAGFASPTLLFALGAVLLAATFWLVGRESVVASRPAL